MKWPFVRRSKHDLLEDELNIVKEGHDRILKHNTQLSDEKDSLCQEIEKKADVIANQMDSIKSQFNEINRLNQELASELNSHRKTKELWHKSLDNNDSFLKEIRKLEKELKETKDALKIAQEDLKVTKDHEQKLFDAHDKLNQQNIGLLYENEKLLKQINQLRFDKSHLKTKVKKLESKLVYFDVEYTTMKKNADWFYGNYCRFKDMIEKSGYFPGK